MINRLDTVSFYEANPDIREMLEHGAYDSLENYMDLQGYADIREGRRRFHPAFAPFDEELYLERFPEVAESVHKGLFESGYRHFCHHGYHEIVTGHRSWPGEREKNLQALLKHFDRQAYLEGNPQVGEAIEKGAFHSVEHYLRVHGLQKIERGLDPFHKDYPPYQEERYLEFFPESIQLKARGEIETVFEHFCRWGYRAIVRKEVRTANLPIAIASESEIASVSSSRKNGGKQLIIAGFHRSGTSMLTQWLKNAGLFVGERLMAPNISNVDGHFEDMDFFRLHEHILRFNQSGWQYTGEKDLEIPECYRQEMRRLVRMRSGRYELWGFKDPRSTLFLDAWYEELEEPYTIVIYRHYTRTTMSLHHRACKDWLTNPTGKELAFWQDPSLGYQMWLAYNRRLIEHVRRHPDRCMVVSQEAILNGYPLIQELNRRYDLHLDEEAASGIDVMKVSSAIPDAPPPGEELEKELAEVWNALEEWSVAPAGAVPGGTGDARRTVESVKTILEKFPTESREDPIRETLEKLSDEHVSREEKVESVYRAASDFFHTGQEMSLLKMLERLAEEQFDSTELWQLLVHLNRRAGREKAMRYSDLMRMATEEKVLPRHHYAVALGYLDFYRFDPAEYFLEKALKGNSDNPHFYLARGRLEMTRCRYEEALYWLEHAMKRFEPSTVGRLQTLLHLCDIYIVLEEKEAKRTIRERLIDCHHTLDAVPQWMEQAVAECTRGDSEEKYLETNWREQLLENIKKRSLFKELSYVVESFPDRQVSGDFLERVGILLEDLLTRQLPVSDEA